MAAPFRTALCDLLGIDHPILVGGMMFLSDARFVASVVNAGAMAFLTVRSFPRLEDLRDQLRLCADLTGGRPFGVNLSFSTQPENNSAIPAQLDLALDHGVRHFETAGLLAPDLVAAIRARDGVVVHKASRLRHACSAERAGVHAVTLVGMEEGGHPGANELTTIVLAAGAAPLLRIPYTVGGGIGTGGQVVAALAMGASGATMGSRFLTADEIWAHDLYKDHVATLDHDCSTTALSSIASTWRVLRNDTVAEVQRLEREGRTSFKDLGHLIRGTIARDHCYERGEWNTGMISIGSAAGFANRRMPTREIVAQLVAEMEEARDRVAALGQSLRRA